MDKKFDETMKFNIQKETVQSPKEILNKVCEALEAKGYNPINQIIGYILSGDPTYITSYNLSLIHISEPTRPCGTSRMPSSA